MIGQRTNLPRAGYQRAEVGLAITSSYLTEGKACSGRVGTHKSKADVFHLFASLMGQL